MISNKMSYNYRHLTLNKKTHFKNSPGTGPISLVMIVYLNFICIWNIVCKVSLIITGTTETIISTL